MVRIDGVPNRKACQTQVRDGMRIERQNAFPSVTYDVLAAADLVFRRGMDHHTLMTAPRALNEIFLRVVRQMGGTGELPDREIMPHPVSTRSMEVDVAVVGGGPAGLSAAAVSARGNRRVLLIDEQLEIGGSLNCEPGTGRESVARLVADCRAAGVEFLSRSGAFSFYRDEDVLAVSTREGLRKVRAARYLYATGGYDQNALFANNDRPGIISARAAGRLLTQYGIVPRGNIVIAGEIDYATRLADALDKSGAEVTRVKRITEASGPKWVSSVLADNAKKISCDLVAVAQTPQPASELPRLHGVEVTLEPALGGFVARADEDGRTSVPNVFVAGDVTGYVGPAAAETRGRKVGETIARSFS